MASRSITEFFKKLGFPFHNVRWSWGAHTRDAVLLRAWTDEMDPAGRRVQVLFSPEEFANSRSHGASERLDHLRRLWAGGMAGYAVLATAVDPRVAPRSIATYDDEAVRAIATLAAAADGSILAELGDPIAVGRLKKHAVTYRVRPALGEFPKGFARPARTFRDSNASYIAQLPAMREWLIKVARRGGKVTYAEAREPFGLRTFEHRNAMDRLGHQCLEAGEPILTSLIVDPKTGRCSDGFWREFRRDDVSEREDCYAFWLDGEIVRSAKSPETPAGGGGCLEALRSRARQFAQVRPEQAAFRRRVFMAFDGACCVTGCRVVQALDAAHRIGRIWSQGHNQVEDGLLLRKDIHAMYDAGLVHITNDGAVEFDDSVVEHYSEYA